MVSINLKISNTEILLTSIDDPGVIYAERNIDDDVIATNNVESDSSENLFKVVVRKGNVGTYDKYYTEDNASHIDMSEQPKDSEYEFKPDIDSSSNYNTVHRDQQKHVYIPHNVRVLYLRPVDLTVIKTQLIVNEANLPKLECRSNNLKVQDNSAAAQTMNSEASFTTAEVSLVNETNSNLGYNTYDVSNGFRRSVPGQNLAPSNLQSNLTVQPQIVLNSNITDVHVNDSITVQIELSGNRFDAGRNEDVSNAKLRFDVYVSENEFYQQQLSQPSVRFIKTQNFYDTVVGNNVYKEHVVEKEMNQLSDKTTNAFIEYIKNNTAYDPVVKDYAYTPTPSKEALGMLSINSTGGSMGNNVLTIEVPNQAYLVNYTMMDDGSKNSNIFKFSTPSSQDFAKTLYGSTLNAYNVNGKKMIDNKIFYRNLNLPVNQQFLAHTDYNEKVMEARPDDLGLNSLDLLPKGSTQVFTKNWKNFELTGLNSVKIGRYGSLLHPPIQDSSGILPNTLTDFSSNPT